MRNKIRKSMNAVVLCTLLITYLLLAGFLYNYTLSQMKAEVRQEATYICAEAEQSEIEYLERLKAQDTDLRITIVDADGTVLYDSREDAGTMENHRSRKEISLALSKGTGEELRKSATMGKQTYYYAVRMEDGTVLRVAKNIDTILPVFVKTLPVMAAILILMMALAAFLARRQTERLIRPINALDLEHPTENVVYEELKPLLSRIEEQNTAKDLAAQMRKEFSANVSHELKTPLTSISGYAEIMMNGLVKPEDVPKFSERIYTEASRVVALIDDTIKLSRLDEENVEIEKENVDLFRLCMDICSRLSLTAEKKGVKMEVTGESVEYEGIRQILDEMVYNICENAITHHVEGGSVSVWVGNTLEGPKIIVTDTGIGIPKEHQERIFERFYRVDKSHSKATGGTGLGLSIVKHGAMLHKAEIRVNSEPDKGTRMELHFHK